MLPLFVLDQLCQIENTVYCIMLNKTLGGQFFASAESSQPDVKIGDGLANQPFDGQGAGGGVGVGSNGCGWLGRYTWLK